MAGKAIHEYKIKFSAETKEFEQDVKHAAKMLEQELYDKMEASDKMNHLKGITEYLHKLDAALTDFTAKHGENLFAEKFGGLDEGLRTSFEKMFKVALSELGKLDEIRNNLFNVSNDEQGMATLKEYETVIKNVYAALGKPIKLNSKKFENKVADIKNALSNLALEWVDVVSNISNGIGFGGEAGFAKTSEEIQAEIDKLQGQVEQYKSLKKQLQHLAEENTKFAQGEQLSNEFAIGNTGKDLLELIKLWKRLNAEHQKFIKSGDTSSVEYFENFSKLTETALKLQKRQASMSEKGRDKLDTVKIGKSTLGDMWDDAYLDAEDFLKEHTDNLNKIPQTIGKIVTETESQMAELQRAMRPKSSGDGVESLYKQLDDLLIKFADLQKRFSTMKFDDPDLDKVEAEIESLKNSILGLAKTDDQLKETSGLLEDFAADDSLKKDDILTKLCNVLGVDLPADLKAAKAQMQEFLALAKTYSGMEYISENDANAGIKKLEEMKAELIELTNQGKLTITEFEKFTSAFDSTVTHLRGMDHAAHSGSGEVDYVQKLKDELRNSFADIDFEASDKYKEIFEQLQDGTLEYTRALSKAKNVYADLNKKKQKQGVREALALLGKEKASYEDLITVIKAYKDAATLAQDEDGGEMSMARNKLRAKLAFGNMTDLIDSDNFDQLLRGKKSVEDIALLLKPHLDTSNLKKEQDAITNEFEKYLDKLEQDGKFDLLNKSDSANYNQVLAEIKNGTLTTVDQCIAKFEELTASTKVTNAYNDVFDVLTKIGDKWKDLDTVDSAIGSMPLSDIDAYIQKLESLIKLIESVDPNFQHGDKTEYDGAVKTLEKMKELSSRTKLTDEFKNTINQFEQLGKFEWSDELTNGYLKILNDIRNGTYKTIGQCVAKFNELSTAANKPTMDVATAFRELVKHISNSHSSPATIFDHLEGTTLKVSDNLKEILQALNLIDSQGKVSLSSLKSGFTNLGGFVSDQYTMIARPGHYIGKIKSIQPKLQAAQQEGAQIGAIFDIIEDKAKNVIYEIQNTVPGKSVFGHHSNKTNPDVLNASAEHIEGLVNTLQILTKNGLFIDWGGDNVLYDSQKGFSVIDMGDKGDKFFTVSSQNTLQENLDRMVKEMFKYASLDMQQALKDNVVKNLYASAQKFDASIVNPYAPKQTRTAKDAQVASAKTAAAVQREEDAHEDNTAAIKAENDALQAQIELKKKAQSMKWEVFATDDSLSALKQAAGMQTLGQLEGFWKKSNYEKQIDFHEISESDAKQIFKDKLPKGLASKWYSSADFLAKSQLENEILADPEIRNAAMSYFWHIFKNSYVASKHPNIKTFDDFINNEFTMYRGDQAPLIYDPSSKLSFSINESTANGFNSNLGTIKIKPRDTIGNAGSVFTSELETFAPSEQTSWFQKNREAFADFYAKQTKEMQKELDAGFVNFEKKRISDIIGDNLSTMTHKALQSSYWQHNVADDLKNGIVPNQLVVPTDGSDYAQFATMYNGLSDTMKRFVMFFARMDDLSASLPKPFSISVPTAGGGFKYGKNAVGAGAELFNAVLNDPEGRHQHIARLTGEKAFNLMGITPAEINAVADAHERNAQAINAEAQAQKDLNSLQDRYDMVMDDLWDSAVDADGSKHNDLSKLWSQLYDVQHSDQDLVNQGLYTQKSTGQSVDATDLFQLVVDIESKYNENLDYVKDYLKQVYSGIGFEGMVPQPISAYESTKTKTYEAAKSAYKSGNQREYFKLLGVLNHLNDIDAASDEDIAAAQYTDADTGRRYDISKILGMVKSIEDAYGENLDYVYDYLKQVYGESTIDDAVDKLQKNDTRTERRPATKYTVEDYQNAYAAAPSDMQEAIDDLAVFQQRYEQLYALTNQRPIEFMFPGKPTLNEAEEVMAIFDEFKAKQQQILHLQLLDYEGNKEQIQELQAEAVGLQNKLRGASLGENADLSEYKMTYGFIDDQDADRFKKLVDMVESVHTVMNDLTRIGEHKMSLIPQEMQDMLDSDTGDAAEQFMAQQAKQVQSAKAAAQQADASVAASKKRLQTEQDITAEKQRQASIDDQQATQTTTDAATNQNVQAEVAALETLNQKIEQVKFAVALKTSAFEQEAITVNKVVNEEIVALEKLKTLLTEIQNSLQVIFAANNWNIGDINTQQSKTSSNAMPNILEAIKSTLEQIYGVLSKTNGVEADNKNSVKVKKPAVENKPIDSDAYKTLAAKIPDDLAKDGTLQQILGAVNIIAKRPKDSENTDLANLSAALLVASTELKNAANGIIEQKKKAQGDTSVAQARIGNKDEYVQIKSAALGSLGDRALDSEVTEMQALANGVVKVTGWLKVAEDAWEGFTVQINKANEASKLAFSTNSKAAKQAAAQAKKLQESGDDEDDLNIKKYNPEETKDLAQEKIAKYTAEGKVATVQFKDSGRYTITTLEKIGGLTKRIFQTFDENDQMIERTTATMSNATLMKVQELQQVAQFGFDNNLIKEDNEIYKAFKNASDALETMNQAYNQADQLSQDQINNWNLQIDAVIKLGKEVQKLVAKSNNPAIDMKANKRAHGATPVINAQSKFNTLGARANPYIDSGWSDVSNAYQQYATALKNLINLQNQFQNGKEPNDAQKIQFNQLKEACSAAHKELKKLVDTADKFNAATDSNTRKDIFGDVNVNDRNSRAEALKSYVQEVYGAKAVVGKFNGDMTELQFTIKNTDGTITNMTAAFNSAKTQIGALHGETKKATTIFDELGLKFKELWRYAAARMGIDELFQAVRKGVEYVREIDAALTDLKKVTDETDATYAKFLQTMSQTAGQVGSTVAELTQMAAEWSRLGYSLEEAGMLAESTAVLLNVSEFDDATTASEALISTMQAFGYAADESQHVVDILNEVGNNYAVSSDGLATALQDSASSLMTAGASLEESVALIAAANKVVQDPNSVGSALRTISLRLRGTSVEVLEQMGEETDGVIESTSKLQEKIKALSGVDILSASGGYRNPYEILKDIAEVYDEMESMDQAALIELISGKNRANTLAAILTNFEDLEGAYNDALGAEGSAMRENSAYLDSIQGRIDLFNNALQTMWMNLLNSDAIKWFVDLGTSLVQAADKIGVLNIAIAGVVTYFTAIKKHNPATMFKDLAAAMQNYNQIVKQIQSIGSIIGPVKNMSWDQFNAGPVNAYAAAVSNLTAKQQAATLAASGLNSEQIASVLAANGLSSANIKLAMSEAGVAQAKTQTAAATGLQIAAAMKQQGVALSQKATNFLLAHSTEEVTKKMLAKAVVAGQITHQEAVLIMKSMGVVAANTAQAFSWKALGTAISAAFKSNPIGMLISIASAVTAIVIPALVALIDSTEEVKQKAEDALTEYSNSQSELKKTKSTVDALSDDYAKLASGVDEFGNNISLSTSQYERYNEIVNQIADMFPQMVKGYTAEGNAIIKNKGNVEALTAAYESLQSVASNTLLASADDIMQNYKNTFENKLYEDGPSTDSNKIKASRELSKMLNNQDTYKFGAYFNNSKNDGIITTMVNLLEDAGIEEKSFTESSEDYVKRAMTEFPGIVQSIINTWESTANAAVSNVKPLVSAYLDTSVGYAGLNEQQKQVIDSMVAYLDEEFFNAFDGDASKLYTALESMIQNLKTSGFDDEYNLMLNVKTSFNNDELTVKEYQDEISEFQTKLDKLVADDLLSETDVKYIKLSLGIDDEGISKELDPMVAYAQKIIDAESKDKVLTLTYSDLQIINSDDFEVPEGTLLSWAELKQKIAEIRATMPTDINTVQTYTALSEKVSSYNDILTQTNEITADHIEVTQEYKDSLSDLGFTTEELSECFDENNELVVKNSEKLRKLVAEKKKAAAADVKLAKSQSRLEYYDLVKQLSDTLSGTKQLDNETRASINSTLKQLNVVEQAIYKYQLLEDSLLGTTNAFEEFAKAQEVDALNTYGDSYVEMVQTMYDGLYKTGEVGTEAFWAAVEHLVPADAYQHLTEDADRIKAIYEYFNKSIAPTLTLKDDAFSIDFDAIENFVEEGLSSGVFTGDTKNFDLVEGMNLDEAAKKLKMTTAQAYAFFAELDKYNVSGNEHSFLSQLDQSTEGKIMRATTELENLNKQKLALLEDGGYEKHGTELAAINDKIQVQTDELNKLGEQVVQTWQDYSQADSAISALNQISDKQTELSSAEAAKFGIEIKEGDKITVENALKQLEERKANLEKPTVLTAQLAQEHIQSELAQLQEEIGNTKFTAIVKAELEQNEDGVWVVKENEKRSDTDTKYAQQIAALMNADQDITAFLETGLSTTDTYLSSIDSTLKSILTRLGGEPDNEKPETTTTTDTVEVTAQEANVEGSGTGVSTDNAGQQYDDPAHATGGGQTNPSDSSESASQIADLNAQLKAAQDNVSQLETSIETLKSEKASIEADFNTAKTEANATISKLTAEKTTADETITKLTSEIAALETAMNTAKTEADNTIAKLEAAITTFEADMDAAKAESDATIAKLTAEIATLKSDMESAKAEADATIDKLTAEKTALEADMNAAKTEITALETAMNTAKAEADATIAKLTSDKSNLETSLEAAKAECEASIAKLSAEKAELEASVAQLTASKTEADKTIAQLNSDKTALETSIANANAMISQLETEKAELHVAIAESKANIEALKADKEDVESDLAQAKEMLSQTKAMLAEAQSALEVANNDLAAANELITSLTANNQNLEAQVGNLNGQLNNANAALANAQAEKAAADATIAKLESALSEADAVIEALSAGTDAPKSENNGWVANLDTSAWDKEATEAEPIPQGDVSVGAEVDLETEEAEEKIAELGEQTAKAFTVEEILINNGLDELSLDNAFDNFGSAIILDTTPFTQILYEAGYTEEQINSLINKIKEYKNVIITTSNPDPLGLHSADLSVDSLKNSLDALGVEYDDTIGQWGDHKRELKIDVPDLVNELKSRGWTDTAIQAYLSQLRLVDFSDYLVFPEGEFVAPINTLIGTLNDIPEDEQTDYEVTGSGEGDIGDINTQWANVPETKTTKYTVYKTTVEQTKKRSGVLGGVLDFLGLANGTAHVDGTAHKGGSWGAPKTETALTGELGPELRVRGNRWELLGENGAEFNEVRRGDIIFNHKQTEELLTNGYITGRGKAFAEGTIGGAAYSGLWKPTSQDDSLSNTAGTELSGAAGDLSGAAGDVSDAADEFREVFDWIEVRLEEINERISLQSARLENTVGSSKQNAIIDDMIALNQKLYDNLTAGAAKYNAYAVKLLAKVPEEYRKAAQDGSIAIEEFVGEADEKTLQAIQDYREWVQKGADATQQAEETLTEIQNLAKQAIDNIAQEYENKASIPGFKIEQLDAYNALIETTQGAESAKIYQAMIKENNKQIGILTQQRNKMQAELNAQVEAGNIKKYSQAWYDAVGEIAAVDTEIINLTTDTENYQDAINELHWDHFDNLISRFEALSDEANNLIDILGSKDMVDENGNWTDEGITSLGLYAQQMEVAEMQAKKYKEEIQYLNRNWQKLGYTEQEYIEKLEELKNGQYDAIKSYNDTKDAIVDLTKERVESIKDGIQKEIDAYSELIEKKKEELDAEKDLYDFQKGVANQQKEIADIERKLAALSADNSASARAKRAQLEAELAEARQELEDTYYDRSVSNQQEALDKELEAFQEEKDKEMEGWDKYLDDTEKVVADGLATIQANTDAVYDTLKGMGQEYSLSIADALTSPWKSGEDAIQRYTDKFKMDMSKTVDELKKIATEHKKIISGIEAEGSKNAGTVNNNVDEYTNAENGKKKSNSGGKSSASGIVSSLSGDIQYGQSGANVKNLQKALNALGFNCGSVDGIFGDKTYAAVIAFQKSSKFGGAISADGIVGPKTKKKFKVAGYAGGTSGVKKDQWALIDELGEELVIRPSKGRMTFMEKGTAVLPADLTANLTEWGNLDPSIMLERNKPVISAPHVTNNNVEINMEFGEVVHIDTVTNDTIPNLTKAIEKQMDKYMKNVNNNIRKYAR